MSMLSAKKGGSLKTGGNWWFRFRFNAKARAEIYEAIAGFTGDGIPLFSCLQDMHIGLEEVGSFVAPMIKRAMARLRGKEGGALTLGEALEGFVPEAEAVLISAGERGGDLTSGLRRAGHVAQSQARLLGAVSGVLAKPVGYLVVAFAMLMLVGNGVIPTLEKSLPRDAWPAYARMLANVADRAGLLVLLCLLLIGVWAACFFITASRMTGPLREAVDKYLFPWGLFGQITEAVLLLSLSAMLRVGLPLDVALDTIASRSGEFVRGRLRGIQQALSRGETPGNALVRGVKDQESKWRIRMYAKTTAFADGLEKLADSGIERLVKSTTQKFGLIGYVILMFICFFVVWVMGSFSGVSMAMRSAVM